jgi:hypothetical protein
MLLLMSVLLLLLLLLCCCCCCCCCCSLASILPVLEKVVQVQRPLVIIAEDVESEVGLAGCYSSQAEH